MLHFNRKAIQYLNQGDFLSSLEYLNKAKLSMKGISLTNCSKVMGITLNNFGCYYKTLNDPEKALVYLNQALELEKTNLSNLNSLAATYLNICATESQLNNHIIALENSLKAIHILKPIYSSSPEVAQTFITAHFNASSEFFALNRSIEGTRILELGLNYSKDLLGSSHFLTKKLQSTLSTLKGKKMFSLSPGRSIRTSTTTTVKKKFKSDIEKSTDTHLSTYSRLSKRFVSPAGFRKTFNQISPIRLSNSKTSKLNLSKIRTRKVRKHKKTVEKKDFCAQFEVDELKISAARRIQRAWRRFVKEKEVRKANIDKDIKEAEDGVQVAYEKLKKLKEFRARLRGENVLEVCEFKPIPYKSKYLVVKDE